jgi:transcriptional regulator with XRE-family HTH domain
MPVDRLERGKCSPRLPVMLRIAEALGVSASELLHVAEDSTDSDARSVRRRRT